MRRQLSALLLSVPLAACATAAPWGPQATPLEAKAEVLSDCALPSGWHSVAAQSPRFVVFGEAHGTNEAPTLFGEIACALAMQGQSVLVAIEHSATDNPALQAAWQLSPHDFPPALLRAGWVGRSDGVASEAMFAMVRRLHALKDSGAAVDIVAFNGERDAAQRERYAHLPAQGPHEAAQAENIADAADRGQYDQVLVLVGAFHAETRPIDRGRGEFVPMAGLLRAEGKVITLGMEHGGGTAWNCTLAADAKIEPGKAITQDMVRCANSSHGSGQDRGAKPFVSLMPEETDRYDGIFYVGTISGSPPAAGD